MSRKRRTMNSYPNKLANTLVKNCSLLYKSLTQGSLFNKFMKTMLLIPMRKKKTMLQTTATTTKVKILKMSLLNRLE